MSARARKIRRRRQPGEVTIEQTHDAALIEAMLDRAAATLRTNIAAEAECFLIAYSGEEPVGIAGLQTEVDAALMSPIFVVSEMRQRAIGARLVLEVRRAAHVRGARTLYTIVPARMTDYFVRLGFTEATGAELNQAVGRASNFHCQSLNPEAYWPLRLDLSQEGIVAR
jgi:N-acetylglutamate synthase-like GNAT family acetyltransferase